ncbi:MAG: hypothetical protein CR988_00620 [Treponema sp.]|nr:MAG: hypothetical protein CR988_00620 [Treponema sp.]
MYLSKYNEYQLRENRVYVYNTRYFNSISFDENDVDKVKKFMLNTQDTELLNLGFISKTDNELNEIFEWYMDLKYSASHLNIMLVMNYNCNCECKYCFENLDQSFLLTKNIDIKKIVNFILDIYKRNKSESLTLTFFGGEPLLSLENILKITNDLNESKINIKYLVITNGTLLTLPVLEQLFNIGIKHFQITIDGPQQIHDIRRPCKNKKSSWKMIIDNLLIALNLDVEITLRINIDNDNIDYFDELLSSVPKKIIDSEKTNIYIAPVVGCLNCTVAKTLKDRASVLKTAWHKISENNYPIPISPPVYAPCPRHSKESAFYLDMYGNIYTCGGFVGNIKRVEKKFSEKFQEYYERLKYIPPKSCFKCSFFPVCMGGCQFETAALGTNCQKTYLKEIYDEYFTKYCQNRKRI